MSGRVEQSGRLRNEPPPDNAIVVVRGGPNTADKIGQHAAKTAKLWTYEGAPVEGISVFLALGESGDRSPPALHPPLRRRGYSSNNRAARRARRTAPQSAFRAQEEIMKIDLRADLMSQDHTGYTWSLLEDAPDPSIIVPGALILAGEEGDPDDPVAVCRVVELEEINSHMVVRFEILPGDIEDYAILVKRHNVNV